MVEGEKVFNEAIEYLNTLPYLKPLEWDDNLSLSAIEHVLDIGPKGLLSYQSSDGTEPEERISKYGNYVESLGENIDFGPNDALGVIVSLTLDDGETDRPHRDNLFKSDYQKVGIACGPHKTEYHMCVMDFAYDFLPFNDDLNDGLNVSNKLQSITNNDTSINGNKTIKTVDKSQQANNISESNNKKGNNNSGFDYEGTLGKTPNFNYIDNNPTANSFSIKQKGGANPNTTSDGTGTGSKNNFTVGENLSNQSPFVKLSLDKEEYKNFRNEERLANINNANSGVINAEIDETANQIKNINLEKRIISKLVEVQTKIIYTFEDGSTKEVIEKQNHTFDYRK
jgi:hypothetical protein